MPDPGDVAKRWLHPRSVPHNHVFVYHVDPARQLHSFYLLPPFRGPSSSQFRSRARTALGIGSAHTFMLPLFILAAAMGMGMFTLALAAGAAFLIGLVMVNILKFDVSTSDDIPSSSLFFERRLRVPFRSAHRVSTTKHQGGRKSMSDFSCCVFFTCQDDH
jgi:hypothetical protein